VRNLVLTNSLPDEYVMDATAAIDIAETGAYGGYDGLTNYITWDNPQGDPLDNTDPQFTLTSGPPASPITTNDGHGNLLRNGDAVVITFGVVLVHQPFYDLNADLDVITEAPGDGTDPDTTLPAHNPPVFDQRNILNVDFENFCTAGTTTETVTTVPVPDPEDLDIETYGPSGPVLDYILTNNTDTTLSVVLTNSGGHSAADYYAYVAFGQTMEVDNGQLPRIRWISRQRPPSMSARAGPSRVMGVPAGLILWSAKAATSPPTT